MLILFKETSDILKHIVVFSSLSRCEEHYCFSKSYHLWACVISFNLALF